jgi:hypothetical protein
MNNSKAEYQFSFHNIWDHKQDIIHGRICVVNNCKVELHLLCRIYVFLTDTNYKTSILPSHVNPFPEYPILHSQIKLPTLFVHSPFTSQAFHNIWDHKQDIIHGRICVVNNCII